MNNPSEILALLDQHWAVEPTALSGALAQIAELDWNLHLTEFQSSSLERSSKDDKPGYTVDANGIATFPITGALTREAHSMSSLFGGTATIPLQRDLLSAISDDKVKGGLLAIHSPGGQVAGTSGSARAAALFAAVKPLVAYADELCASAAYWIASAATEIVATPTALVGSIGVLSVVKDTSARAERLGVKTHVVGSGDLKGAGTEGTVITEAHLDSFRANVTGLSTQFFAAVAAGRKLNEKQMAKVTRGNCFVATEAKSHGLIDHIGDEDTARQRLLSLMTKPAAHRGKEKAQMNPWQQFQAWRRSKSSPQAAEVETAEASELMAPVDFETFTAFQAAQFTGQSLLVSPSAREKELEDKLAAMQAENATALNVSQMAAYAKEGKFTPAELAEETVLRAESPVLYDKMWAKRPVLDVAPAKTVSGDAAAVAAAVLDAGASEAIETEYQAMLAYTKATNRSAE